MRPQKSNENPMTPGSQKVESREEAADDYSPLSGLILAALLLGSIFALPLLSRWVHY